VKCAAWALVPVLVVSVAFAGDSLVEDMELEIRIQNISEEVYKWADKRSQDAAKKTTLGKQWQAVRQQWDQSHKGLLSILNDKQRLLKEIEDYRRRFELDWYTKPYDYRSTRQWSMWNSLESDAEYQRLRQEYEDRDKAYEAANKPQRRLFDKMMALRDKLSKIANKFRSRLYTKEMKARLKKLEMEITKDILKKIEQAYKMHTA